MPHAKPTVRANDLGDVLSGTRRIGMAWHGLTVEYAWRTPEAASGFRLFAIVLPQGGIGLVLVETMLSWIHRFAGDRAARVFVPLAGLPALTRWIR